MKFARLFQLLSLPILLLLIPIARGGDGHWGYLGERGPEHWAKLNHAFENCALGRNQSPIDIDDTIEAELPDLSFFYKTAARDIVNNGHSIQHNFPKGAGIVVDDHAFELKQVHFHSPSENTIGGRHFPMEAHFVHMDDQGALAVVAVMFEEGSSNPYLDKAWRFLPSRPGQAYGIAEPVSPSRLLPDDKGYYRFNGSLTTPPCSEGVFWFVMKQPVQASAAQIGAFKHIMHHPNNRPVQPLNARPVLR